VKNDLTHEEVSVLRGEDPRRHNELPEAQRKRRSRFIRRLVIVCGVMIAIVAGGTWWLSDQLSAPTTQPRVAASRAFDPNTSRMIECASTEARYDPPQTHEDPGVLTLTVEAGTAPSLIGRVAEACLSAGVKAIYTTRMCLRVEVWRRQASGLPAKAEIEPGSDAILYSAMLHRFYWTKDGKTVRSQDALK
jgi:hypothetical protein